MRYAWFLFAVSLGLSILAGCNSGLPAGPDGNGDGLNQGGDPGGVPQPLTEDEKHQAIADLGAAFISFPHASPEEDNQLLILAIQSQGSFSAVELGEGMLLATFIDGEEMALFNDVSYEEQRAALAGGATMKPAARTKPTSPIASVKQKGSASTRIVVVNNSPSDSVDGKISKDGLDAIVAMSQSLNYTVQSPDTSSYFAFTNSFKNLDGMVWFGHAGNANGKFFFEIPLFPEVNEAHADFQNKVVIRGAHFDWSQGAKEFMAANDQFVSLYWRFKPGSFLLMSTCFGASDGAKLFRQACLSGPVGLDAFFGWTGETLFKDMEESARVLVDMIMGANKYYSPYHLLAGGEASRAWSYQTTLSDMGKLQRGVVFSFGKYVLTKSFYGYPNAVESDLIYRRANGSDFGQPDLDTVWEPGIQNLTVAESDTPPSTLTISGSFGDQRLDGKVTINGNELPVKSWTHSLITCDLPNDGDDAAGEVVVERNGRQSNPVNLTQWSGLLLYTENYNCSDPGKLEWHTSKDYGLDMQLRGDVHSYRIDPSTSPQSDSLSAGAMKSVSKVTSYNTMGTITEPQYDDQHQLVATQITTFSAGPAFTPPLAMSQIPGNASFGITFYPDQHRVEVFSGTLNLMNGEHVVSEYQHPILPHTDEFDQVLTFSLGVILGLIDPSMTLNAGSFDTGSLSHGETRNTTFHSGNGESQGTVSYSLQVGPFSAAHAPDPQAPR